MTNFKLGLLSGALALMVATAARAENREALDASPFDQKVQQEQVQVEKSQQEKEGKMQELKICHDGKTEESIPKGKLLRGADYI